MVPANCSNPNMQISPAEPAGPEQETQTFPKYLVAIQRPCRRTIGQY